MRHQVFLGTVFAFLGLLSGGVRALGGDDEKPAPKKSFAELLKEVRSKDAKLRLAAAIGLAEHGPQAGPAVPALLDAVQTGDEELRLNAAVALSKVGKTAVKPLTGLLASKDAPARFYAAAALALIGRDAEPAVEALRKALTDKNDNVRRKALYALDRIVPNPEMLIPTYVQALGDPAVDILLEATERLARHGVKALPALIAALKDANIRFHATTLIGALGPDAADAVPALRALLRDREEGMPEVAAAALGRIGKAAVAALTGGIRDDRARVRGAAIQALGEVGADARPVLLTALRSEHADVRREAARVLPQTGADKDVILALARALKDRDEEVRVKAAVALHVLAYTAKLAAPALIDALSDPSPAVRRQAIYTLNDVGQDPGVPPAAIPRLVADKDPWVRIAAVHVLPAQGKAALPHFLTTLKDPDLGVRTQALYSLDKLKGDLAKLLPAVVPFLEDKDVRTRQQAFRQLGRMGEAALPHLIKGLTDPDQWIRSDAFTGLGNLGPAAKKAVPALLETLQGPPSYPGGVRAVWAVLQMGPEHLAPLFKAIRQANDANIRYFAYQYLVNPRIPGKAATPYLIEGLKDEQGYNRIQAAKSLGQLGAGGKAAVPALTAALNDPTVAQTARAALKQIQGK